MCIFEKTKEKKSKTINNNRKIHKILKKRYFTLHKMCNKIAIEFKDRREKDMEELKRFRNELGLTQTEFAKEIGISASFYIKVESRK